MDWKKATAAAVQIASVWSNGITPGGAIIAFDTQGVRVETYGGFADIATRRPFDRNTAVRFASITKHLTAAAGLVAQDRAAIDLASPIAAYLDDTSSAIGRVSLARALDMTSGVPDFLDTAWLLGSSRSGLLGAEAALRFGLKLPELNFAPGTEFSYSNAGYALLEAVLAKQGLPLGDALGRQFFDPLGCSLGIASDQTEPIPYLAPGYWPSPEGWRLGVFGVPYTGADSLVGSPWELAKWLRALLADEAPAKGLLQLLSASRYLADGRETELGLGIARFPLGGTILLGFGGQLPGYASQFLLHPDMGCGVLVAANREDGNSSAIALQLMAELLNLPLPKTVSSELPEGLFATEEGPFWLTYGQGQVAYMGVGAPASINERTDSVNGSPYLPLELTRHGDLIVGQAGYVPRSFAPVPPDLRADSAWRGRWENASQGAVLQIEVHQGDAEIIRGVGVNRSRRMLKPIGNARALFQHREGPRIQHICLELTHSGVLRLSTHRSRIAEYVRSK